MNGLLTAITNVNNAVNGVVWGVPALVLLAFVGVLMTVLTKVFQVTHFGHWMKKTIGAVFKQYRRRFRRDHRRRPRRRVLDVGHGLPGHDDQLLRKCAGHLLPP